VRLRTKEKLLLKAIMTRQCKWYCGKELFKENIMIICECGKRYEKVCDFTNVKQIGLALYGNCPKCGMQHGIGHLWRLKKTYIIQSRKIEGRYPKTLDLSKSRS
jgi:hypothetical protein